MREIVYDDYTDEETGDVTLAKRNRNLATRRSINALRGTAGSQVRALCIGLSADTGVQIAGNHRHSLKSDVTILQYVYFRLGNLCCFTSVHFTLFFICYLPVR